MLVDAVSSCFHILFTASTSNNLKHLDLAARARRIYAIR